MKERESAYLDLLELEAKRGVLDGVACGHRVEQKSTLRP
jgi:hypothetical protein